MKKTVALILVLCMMAAAMPALAGSAGETPPTGSGLGELLSGLLQKAEEKIKESDSSGILSGLIDQLKKGGGDISGLLPQLKELFSRVIKDPTGKFSALLSKLKEKLSSGGAVDLEALLGTLLGGGDTIDLKALAGSLLGGAGTSGESDESLEEELAETIEKLNREAEADKGEFVPDMKQAESVEEFYGHWTETKIVFDNNEYDMSDAGEGAFFAENTYYITQNGEKSPDYPYPETAELTIRDGVLKICSDGHWTTYVMTTGGEIVLSGSSLLCYFKRADP